jgi:hypothetical protein
MELGRRCGCALEYQRPATLTRLMGAWLPGGVRVRCAPFSLCTFFADQFRTSNLLGSSVEKIRVNLKEASIMGKYFLGWILGVPVFVLVIIYLIFN